MKARICNESREALLLIYAVDNLDAARTAQARSQASSNAVREEDLRDRTQPQPKLEHLSGRDPGRGLEWYDIIRL